MQEECLPSLRLRAWTCHRCAYRLPRMQKGKRSMTRCLTGSYCWDRDRRRLKRKRPGILPYTGSLPQHNHPRKYAFLSRSPTEMSEIKLPERLHTQRKYAVGYMRVQGWLERVKPRSRMREPRLLRQVPVSMASHRLARA